MGESSRLNDIYEDYGWYLTLKRMCKYPEDLDRISELPFRVIIDWLELQKAEDEIEYIQMELSKTNINKK